MEIKEIKKLGEGRERKRDGLGEVREGGAKEGNTNKETFPSVRRRSYSF